MKHRDGRPAAEIARPGLVYGFHPVREVIRRGSGTVRRVLISDKKSGGRRRTIEEMCRELGLPVEVVPEQELDRRCGGVHNGFAVEIDRSATSPRPDKRDPSFLVLVEDIQDPRNLGALLRSCEAVGVGRVLVRDRGSAPMSPTVVKASAGAAEWLPVERITNTASVIKELQGEGYWVYGADASGEPPWEIDLRGKLVLCLGGEAGGLRARTRNLCDGLVGLPMVGAVESLNVAAAAAALLYEALRQRSGSED